MKLSIVCSRAYKVCFFALALTPLLAGCGGSDKASAQYAVRGKVLYKGQPAAEAIVVLHPINKAGAPLYPPRGVTDKNGLFVIGSRLKDDGAPEGEYAVTIIWPEEQDPKNPTENTPPDRLKNRYNDAKNAKWRVRVSPNENELAPFQLQ